MKKPYKMKYKPNYSSVLRYYKRPLPMVGDNVPSIIWAQYESGDVWDKRCRFVYDAAMQLKKNIVPTYKRLGLWQHDIAS